MKWCGFKTFVAGLPKDILKKLCDLSLSERSCAVGHGTSSLWGLGIKDFIDLPLGWEDLKPFLSWMIVEISIGMLPDSLLYFAY